MKSNYEYVTEFIEKHHYHTKIKVQCLGSVDSESIKTVEFDKRDIPSERKIKIEDIRFDIDSLLPEDVFYRWLEHVDNKNNEYVDYMYWLTKTDHRYVPKSLENVSTENIKKLIYDKLEQIKKMRWV